MNTGWTTIFPSLRCFAAARAMNAGPSMKWTIRSLQRVMIPSAKMTNGNFPSATVLIAHFRDSRSIPSR